MTVATYILISFIHDTPSWAKADSFALPISALPENIRQIIGAPKPEPETAYD